MTETPAFPRLRQIVLDCTDPRQLAEFYRAAFGLSYRPGDEPPAAGEPDPNGQDWLVLRNPNGSVGLAFQRTEVLPRSTWPSPDVPQQLHLDTSVPDTETLTQVRRQMLALGATELYDRFDDPDEPLYVFADPAGHPFCVFVAAE